MEQIAESIKNFILTNVNAELPALAEDGVSLPAVEADNIIFGTVDLSRYSGAVLVSILPDLQEPDEDEYIDGLSDRCEFTITFLFQKATYPILIKRMSRYARAFRLAQAKKPDWNIAAYDAKAESKITTIDFFPDTGAVPQQMTACEISLDVTTEEPFN